ncbi:UDP-N-acetylglucosamine-N-acetylmuramylpentapeptide N-acetylglucosamine transferase [Austwickia chelonae]|uniref:UDP-N-acetylglucosamine--N-acetylmuramyl-(pentapeptide) pyrophosphoryl-undecaprenol N-acetylglucosamine transferase n=1 Tax=Austwickia chelonae NBRC 105200 TaxID=1184607 RepID=K6V360_9MICO|nr:undecaprenyldiphospho-muramoylpentapeptide beta-N-acetylglucosaminyltransferase [Austwickia chelonae]GAB76478.1 UDP-N-acetylglucosamine--N-acetylmuramyl-(pentapeptide) pyrophosphoryl-undecaprenol N-acetylglucosamine transferase [Austwickia chelonae NBRC 105200]SEW25410.1 UDP-N-acetylglucosamine-N-acetylmuramylpentapeptide N-acetylglucosamine transferase [Austwickia chelonae]
MTSARPDVPESSREGSLRVPRGPRSVVLAGGGSAGHVSPLLALADSLRRRDPSMTVTALGTSTGLEQRLVPERGYPLRSIPKVVFPRKAHVDALRLPAMLKDAVDLSGDILDEVAAEVVVGFGGYVSSPAYLAAKKRGIPIVIHEQNARPGLANRLGARLTPYVATTFVGTDLAHARVVGMPLRGEITGLDRAAERVRARAHFGLEPDGPVLLVTGGSLGAAKLNSAFAEAAGDLSQSGVQVLHVTGLGKEFTPEGANGAPYVVLPYVDRMDLAYAAADLVVCRSGANTVCELAAVGLPAIFVPLPIGNGEQRFNAADVQAAGGCLLFDDADVNAFWVRAAVIPLLRDEARCLRMAEAMARSGRRDGDEGLADLVYEAWRESTR